MSNKKNIFVVLPMLFAIGAILLIGAPVTSALAQGYATGPGPIRIVNVANEDLNTINETPAPAVQEPEAEAPVEEEAPPAVVVEEEDLDCSDIKERNFAVAPEEDVNNFDGDNDGTACEEVVVTVVVVEENGTTSTEAEVVVVEDNGFALVAELKVEILSAKTVLQSGNTDDAIVHIDNALALLGEVQEVQVEEEQPVAPVAEEEAAAPVAEPEKPTVPVEEEAAVAEESAAVVAEGEPAGNVVDPVQVFGTTLQECIEEIINAGLLIIQSNAQEDGNTEVVEAIEENPEVVETAMNETGTTEQVVEVIGENLPAIVTNETSIEEVVEEEVVPILEENSDEVVTEIEEATSPENVPAIEEEIIS